MGFLAAKPIEAFSAELNTCRATLNLALTTANLYVTLVCCESLTKLATQLTCYLLLQSLESAAQIQVSKELLKQKDDETRQEGDSLVQKTSTALTRISQISLGDDDEEEIDLKSVRDLKKDIKRRRESVQEYKELLATVLVKYTGQRTGVKVKNVKVLGKSNALVGVQNLGEKESEVQVSIDDVLVDGGSSAMVGVQVKSTSQASGTNREACESAAKGSRYRCRLRKLGAKVGGREF
ncbi:hypothetical protein BU23DRAFT_133666 [Bimuria novae-zelandiae CBS 107.79]|uniref:Fungal N-terminal domain-containing protein n=1 Tax=Bimuria novae-zelandiae CBS 107.79 TaxID=1447943 RepID=A0A6A5V8Z9_9PLEO|nr:hypothetical protein BU23DRAFT_133666 [Bimuria novae-zelandiae CBS 107.79]